MEKIGTDFRINNNNLKRLARTKKDKKNVGSMEQFIEAEILKNETMEADKKEVKAKGEIQKSLLDAEMDAENRRQEAQNNEFTAAHAAAASMMASSAIMNAAKNFIEPVNDYKINRKEKSSL